MEHASSQPQSLLQLSMMFGRLYVYGSVRLHMSSCPASLGVQHRCCTLYCTMPYKVEALADSFGVEAARSLHLYGKLLYG